MNWYRCVSSYYQDGLWSKGQVWDAVLKGKITTEQYTTTTGEPYPTERPIE